MPEWRGDAAAALYLSAGLFKLVPGVVGLVTPTDRLLALYGVPPTAAAVREQLTPILQHRGLLLAIVGAVLSWQGLARNPAGTRTMATGVGLASALGFVFLFPPTPARRRQNARLHTVSALDVAISAAIATAWFLSPVVA